MSRRVLCAVGAFAIAVAALPLSRPSPVAAISGPANSIAVALQPTSLTADGVATSTATATVKDILNNPVTTENVTFSTSGDVTFGSVTNHNDGTYTATVTASTTADTETITGHTSNGKTGTATLTEVPGPVAHVALVLDHPYIAATSGSATATATVTDAHGNPEPGLTVAFSTDGDAAVATPGTDHHDGTYTSAITAGTQFAPQTISAIVGGHTGTATLHQFGSPTTLLLALNPSTLVADGASHSAATVTITDSHGVGVTGATPVIAFSTPAGPSHPSVGSVADNGDGTYSATITSGTAAEQSTVTATANALSSHTVLTDIPGAATTVTVTLQPSTITADGSQTSTATATLTDSHSNPVPGATVAFTSQHNLVSIGGTTDRGDGTYTAIVTARTTAGGETITATAQPGGAQGSANLLLQAGTGASLTLGLAPSQVATSGTSTGTVTLLDTNHNPVTGATFDCTGSSAGVVCGTFTDHGDGTYTTTVTAPSSPGPATVHITQLTKGSLTTQQTLTVYGSVQHVQVILHPGFLRANGTSQGTIDVRLTDSAGDGVPGSPPALGSSGDVTIGSVTDHGDGTYSATVTASSTPGPQTITASAGGHSGTAILDLYGDATTLGLTLKPGTLTADGVSTSLATASVTDAGGNPVADEAVTIGSNGDAAVGTVANNGDGTYTATITASITADHETITGTATHAASHPSGSATLVETPGAATHVGVALVPSTITADHTQTSTGTATVTDVHGNPVAGDTVTWMTDGDVTFGTTVDHGDGTYTVTITSSTTPGVQHITATDSTAAAHPQGGAVLTQVAGPPANVGVSLTPSTITANGINGGSVHVTLSDVNTNPTPGATVDLSTDGDVTFGAVHDNGDGTYTAPYTSSNTADTEHITATVHGTSVHNSATLTEVAPSGRPYHSLAPTRIADTRPGSGFQGAGQRLGPGGILTVSVAGVDGVPASATAVVLNVTATGATGSTFVSVYPHGGSHTTSTLNVTPGRDIANLAEVKLPASGMVDVFNNNGDVDIVVDVEGYVGTAAQGAGLFNPQTPARIADTRPGSGGCVPMPCQGTGAPLGPGGSLVLQVTGRGNVPATGVAAVALNLTVAGPSANSFLAAFPSAGGYHGTSNLNAVAGVDEANRVIVPVDGAGQVTVLNNAGSVNVVVDVNGWFTDGSNIHAGGLSFTPLDPSRICDTRTVAGGSPQPCNGHTTLSGGQTITIPVTGLGGVPADSVSTPIGGAVVNVTATGETVAGFLSVFPTGTSWPNTSDVNFTPNTDIPNLAVVRLGPDGQVQLLNSGGSTDAVVDVFGYYS